MLPSDRYATQIALPPTDIVANRTRRSSLVLVSRVRQGLALRFADTLLFPSMFRSLKVSINQPVTGLGGGMCSTTDFAQQLLDQIDTAGSRHNDCVSPERELCKALGTTRIEVRKALAELEAQGRIWRHVGRDTFVGSRPGLNLQDVTYPGDQINPAQVGQSRYLDARLPKFGQIHASALVDCFDMTDSSASPAVAWRFG